MKKLITFIFAAIFSMQMFADKTIEKGSEIKQVTVYRKGAQITRVLSQEILPGNTTLIIPGLSSKLDKESIQVKASDNIQILSVVHGIDYLSKNKNANTKILQLLKRQEILNDSLNLCNVMIGVYKKENEMLNANKAIGGENGVSMTELAEAAKFFRKQLTEINTNLLKLSKEKEGLEKKKRDVINQLSDLNAQMNTRTSTITIKLKTPAKTNGKFEIKYLVKNAGWGAFYDARIENTNKPLKLNYKAGVYQNTNEDWKNVKLVLSTGDPSISNYKPELETYYLSFDNYYGVPITKQIIVQDEEIPDEFALTTGSAGSVAAVKSENMRNLGYAAPPPPPIQHIPLAVNRNQTNITFDIEVPYTIPSDNKTYDVQMLEYEIPATYEFSSVPKLSEETYLIANIPDWTDYKLLDGDVNLFFNGVYQGQTYLDLDTPDDTLSLSVGRDKEIMVKRELKKDFSSKQSIGSNKKEVKAWEITVKNNKKHAVTVLLEDQYPVSKEGEIKVDLLESSGAKIDEAEGKLNWKLELKPGETKKLLLKYEVKYPKDKKVIID